MVWLRAPVLTPMLVVQYNQIPNKMPAAACCTQPPLCSRSLRAPSTTAHAFHSATKRSLPPALASYRAHPCTEALVSRRSSRRTT